MEDQKLTKPEDELVAFVVGHLDKWRTDMSSNYYDDWDRYERMWLGIYDDNDRERKSERSRLISPDTSQAIETYEAEMIEAVFGGDKWFDIIDDGQDQDKLDIETVANNLREDFELDKVSQAIKECITFAAVYGKGIGELILDDKKTIKPVTKNIGDIVVGGTEINERFSVRLHPIHPRNFIIDPTATCVEEAMGCAVVEMVGAHQVIDKQRRGIYRDVPLYPEEPDSDDEITRSTMPFRENQVRLTKYYGKVPAKWITKIKDGDNDNNLPEDSLEAAIGVGTDANPFEDYADLVEAVIVIANGGILLKAELSPFMMKDRPIVAYDCDPIPGKFWGRGIAQKGLMMQSAIDAQLRMHMDSLALTAAPMMGLDATRLPRGFQFEIYPGRSIKFNGPPAEAAMPFKFGETTPMSMETAQVLEKKFLQATGTLDAAGLAVDGMNGAGQNPGVSLAMSGIIKKNRRSLMNFTSGFLMPLVSKAAWRYMQWDSERYKVRDYKFVPISTLGMIAREYEQQHLMAVMSTLGPDSPLVPMLMIKYVEHSGLQNKMELIQQLQEMMKPDPKAQEMQQKTQEMQIREVMAKIAKTEGEAKVDEAKAADLAETTRLREFAIQVQMMGNLTKNSEKADEFNQRVQIATLALKELDINMKAKDNADNVEIVREQMKHKNKQNSQ